MEEKQDNEVDVVVVDVVWYVSFDVDDVVVVVLVVVVVDDGNEVVVGVVHAADSGGRGDTDWEVDCP